ncbi:MAG: hypothetical protein ACNS63_04385 [Candidatus Nitrospinota bacterium M3_3B_026]
MKKYRIESYVFWKGLVLALLTVEHGIELGGEWNLLLANLYRRGHEPEKAAALIAG